MQTVHHRPWEDLFPVGESVSFGLVSKLPASPGIATSGDPYLQVTGDGLSTPTAVTPRRMGPQGTRNVEFVEGKRGILSSGDQRSNQVRLPGSWLSSVS